jgi:hypothetical protein
MSVKMHVSNYGFFSSPLQVYIGFSFLHRFPRVIMRGMNFDLGI